MRTQKLSKGIVILSILAPTSAMAQDEIKVADISDLSLFDLDKVEVTSVSRQPERQFEAAAAVFVLTGDDIRRSGATSIPEALRGIPGIEVARIDASKWAITARGFNRQFAKKLLVLIDGRSVYTPLFSGVYWDTQDRLLEDVERIEVIRGPGATLWGANAVNGVINIITKDSKFSQGGHVAVTKGSFLQESAEMRYGGKISDNLHYRISGKNTVYADTKLQSGETAYDQWDSSLVDIRVDYSLDNENDLTFFVNTYRGQTGRRQRFPDRSDVVYGDEEFAGFNAVGRWDYSSKESNAQLQFYVDYIERDTQYLLDQTRLTFDVDWQNGFNLSDRLNVIWGLGYRHFVDNLENSSFGGVQYINYTPQETHNNLFSGFLQGKYTLLPNELFLTLGSKFEHNFFTGFEVQPNVRMTWLPDHTQTVWGAISRAVRTPSRGERDLLIAVDAIGPTLIQLNGQPQFDAETSVSYELGYRIQPLEWLKFDIAGYVTQYREQLSFEQTGTPIINLGNNVNGTTKGIEIFTTANVTKNTNLQIGYGFFDFDLSAEPGSTDVTTEGDEHTSPQHSFSVGSRSNLSENLELDTNVYFVDELEAFSVGEHIRLDIRLAWRPIESLELSLTGQNLLDSQHPEFEPFLYAETSEIPRSLYARAAWKF